MTSFKALCGSPAPPNVRCSVCDIPDWHCTAPWCRSLTAWSSRAPFTPHPIIWLCVTMVFLIVFICWLVMTYMFFGQFRWEEEIRKNERVEKFLFHQMQVDAVYGHGLTVDGDLFVADPQRGLLIWNGNGQLQAHVPAFYLSLSAEPQLRVFECRGRIFVQEECESRGVCVFVAAEQVIDNVATAKTKRECTLTVDRLKQLHTWHREQLQPINWWWWCGTTL